MNDLTTKVYMVWGIGYEAYYGAFSTEQKADDFAKQKLGGLYNLEVWILDKPEASVVTFFRRGKLKWS